ncbi:MAG: type II secretion system protein [Planctomycetota bacterium]
MRIVGYSTSSMGCRRDFRRLRPLRGFTLVELLTVMFIVALLIAILIPSLNNARNSAKRTSTKSTLNALKVALESFRSDNERDFPATNGYPPSFMHPPMKDVPGFRPHEGNFPFLEGMPTVFGAHWLPAMLMGVDTQGYLRRSAVPENLRGAPSKWYKPDLSGKIIAPRSPLYLDTANIRLTATRELPGSFDKKRIMDLFPGWGSETTPPDERSMRQLPVIVDPFEQPILYYAANKFGTTRNLVDVRPVQGNDYGVKGPPVYFQGDNSGFTGFEKTQNDYVPGWNFGGGPDHPLGHSGDLATILNIDTFDDGKTFARYIHDHRAEGAIQESLKNDNTPLKANNADTYILVSAGLDGAFGTKDDINNLPVPEN